MYLQTIRSQVTSSRAVAAYAHIATHFEGVEAAAQFIMEPQSHPFIDKGYHSKSIDLEQGQFPTCYICGKPEQNHKGQIKESSLNEADGPGEGLERITEYCPVCYTKELSDTRDVVTL